MIRAALARSKAEQLRLIAEKFGIEQVQAEWDILMTDPRRPYSDAHILVCNRILVQIKAELAYAY